MQIYTTLSSQVLSVETKSSQEAIDKSIKRISIYVGKELLENSTLLLPPVHQLLCQYINEEFQVQNLDTKDMTKVTSRRVLNNLTATLKHHLMYNCSVQKYGTLLYRPQVDLRPALAQALWRSKNISTQSTNENYTSSNTKLYNVTSDTELLRELNTQINYQIKEVLSKDAVAVVNHDQIDINHLIDEIPPKLLQAVTLLTESVLERRGTSRVSKIDCASYHIKRIRHFFLIMLHDVYNR